MLTISEALRLGREASKSGESHRKNLESLGKLVERYAATHWRVQLFNEIETRHVIQLIRDMEAQGRSASYIKHAVNAIRLASNYASDYLGMDPIRIEKRHIPIALEAPKIWLTYRQIATACRVARDTDSRRRVDTPMSHPRPLELARLIMLVCGICGLRLTEFGQLTEDCLSKTNNLTITDNAATGKTIKNDSSRRIIPLPGLVSDALREYWGTYGQWSKNRYSISERVSNLLCASFNDTHDDLYTMIKAKDLRKSFINELEGVVEDKYLMAYGGWSFKGTMYRNYMALRPRPNDPEPIKQRTISLLREVVVLEMEKKCNELHF